MPRRDLIDVALGVEPAETLVVGGNLINVLTAEIYPAEIAIRGGRIAAVGDVSYTKGPETRVIDAEGRFITPGLVDGHLHSYHSYLGVNEYVQVMLRHGVTATADGFYGQGVVGGIEAIRFFKDAFDRAPIRLIFLVPTLAYLQNRELGLTPTPGISAEQMFEILEWDGCLGLEEPPYLPVVEKFPEFLDLLDATLAQRKVITGHAAGINERHLQAYAAVGVATDHESVEHHDALAKARLGIKLLAREGSGASDVAEIVRTVTEHNMDSRSLGFCADLASPEKLVKEGSVDQNIRIAIAHGMSPIKAVQAATINVAEVFYLQHEIGSVAPGRYADLLFVDDLSSFSIDTVIYNGEVAVHRDEYIGELPEVTYPKSFYGTVKLSEPVTSDALTLKVEGGGDTVDVRVIGVTEGSLGTHELRSTLDVVDGVVVPDFENDVLPLAMIDRFQKGTGIGLGFVQGFKLTRGAIASSVNAVCENLIVLGTNTEDMAIAVNHLAGVGGGKIVVADGEILALAELKLLGLLSEDPLPVMMEKFDRTLQAIADLGCTLRSPFSQLEFCCACGEIGDIKLSEEGLVLLDPPRIVDVVLS